MENQANASDKNVQQIGQNLVNQPVQIPEKPKINYLISGLIVCFLLLGVGGYYFASQFFKTTGEKKIPSAPHDFKETNAINPSGKLVYIYHGDLWTMNVVNSEEKQLTHYGYNEKPVLSLDNHKIAFLSFPQSEVAKGKGMPDCANQFNVWIINSDGTDPVQITNNVASRSTPSWSPNSDKIVFTENEKIIIYDIENKTKKTIATNASYNKDQFCGEGGGGGISRVSWSPKNNIILHSALSGPDQKTQLVDALNGNIVKTIDSLEGQWSPDSSYIIYGVDTIQAESVIQNIVVLSLLDGKKNSYKAFNDRASFMRWSPEGGEALYHSSEDSVVGKPPLRMSTIHVLDLRTQADRNVSDKAIQKFVEQRKESGMQVIGSYAHGWSPDGRFIIVDIHTEEHKPEYKSVNQISLVNSQTGEVVKTLKETRSTYTDIKGYITDVSWSRF